jgi:hypothetical protein
MAKPSKNMVTTETIRKGEITEKELMQAEKAMAKLYQDEEKMTTFLPVVPGVQSPLPVGINGVNFVLPLGEEITIPKSLYKFLMTETNVFNPNYGKTVDKETGLTVEQKLQRKANQ